MTEIMEGDRPQQSWWRRLLGLTPPQPERSIFDEIDDMMRAQDPDYDEKRRLNRENAKLRARRDTLAKAEENERLKAEIASLERQQLQRFTLPQKPDPHILAHLAESYCLAQSPEGYVCGMPPNHDGPHRADFGDDYHAPEVTWEQR